MIIFTDLDGTLLDHETYSHAAARPALKEIRRRDIPLVLASSKTAAEIAPLRLQLGFEHCPAIVENGAGILEPGTRTPNNAGTSVSDYNRIRQILAQVPTNLRTHFHGFGDWDTTEVASRTGLSLPDAQRAKAREHSEPGLWTGSQDALRRFLAHLSASGISPRQGGRFLTLSFGKTKADRMEEIAARYRTSGALLTVIALGDAPNDIEMIEAATIGIIVTGTGANSIPKLAGEETGRIIRTQKTGPAGWNEALLPLVRRETS